MPLTVEMLSWAVLGLSAFSAVLLALLVWLLALQVRQVRRMRGWLSGPSGADVSEELAAQGRALTEVRRSLEELRAAQAAQRALLLDCVRHVGAVRFRAFEDAGSDLSFSVALLDDRQNGVVLSSLFGRQESRTYAKPIEGGQSAYALSEEERLAIARALRNGVAAVSESSDLLTARSG